MRGKIYSINRLNPPPPTVRKLLYQVYILPILDYCDVVWTPTNANQTRRLERLHSKYTSCTDSSISRYSLVERRKFHTIMQIYKILHKLAPMYLHNMFDYAITVTGCMNRNVHRFFVPQIHTNYGKRSLRYRGSLPWNTLSTALYSAATFTQFKNIYLRTF